MRPTRVKKAERAMVHRRSRIVALEWSYAVCALMALLVLAGSAVAAAAPAWRISSLSNTTAAPGGALTYFVQVTNIGDADTSTSYEVDITLPTGVTGVDAGNADTFGDPSDWVCDDGSGGPVAGASTIRCVNSDALPPHVQASNSVFIVDVAVDSSVTDGAVLTSRFQISGGDPSHPTASTADPTRVSAGLPGFGVDAFDGQVSDATGGAFTQAGGHPIEASTSLDFNTLTNANPFIGPLWPVEPAKDVLVDLPPGFVGNPTVAAECTAGDLANAVTARAQPLCAPASQVGATFVRINDIGGPTNVIGPLPVFNMVPPPNVPARFGFNVFGTVVTLDAQLRSSSDYGLSVGVKNIPEGLAIAGTTLSFWGVPADSSHDGDRACPGNDYPAAGGPTCSAGVTPQAFLRNPTSCTAPGAGLRTTLHIDSWTNPGAFQEADFDSHMPPAYPSPPTEWGPPQGPTGCEKVPFEPTLSGLPASDATANAPAGFVFDLALPQNNEPASIGEGDLKKAVVTLPAGVRLSPAAAAGLQGCSPEQIGLHRTDDPTCPDGSKVGSLTIETPLLDKPLSGAVYLATPHENPFGSLVAIYLVAKGPGLIVKLAGNVEMDPSSGQVTATFDDQPQLPFSNLHLEFKGGPRAPLVTPVTCGIYTTHAILTSWSGTSVSSDSSFTLSADGHGAPCPSTAFSPGFAAWTENPVAGADSPFQLALTRGDQDQELDALTVYMPGGLLGRIASTVLCPETAANAGTCQDVSKIGSVTVGAGTGSASFYITAGRAYITGPYKGAPYGLSIVVPAVAGPFDLGNVVVRAAIHVDRQSAALKVVSDPLPRILQGIPLDVRDVRVAIDRPHFILNPTSCAEKHVYATVGSIAGAIAHGRTRFQVGECGSLPLAPKITLSVGANGHTKAGASTPFSTTLTQTPGQSNLRSVSVTLPSTLNALLPVVNQACKLAEFQAGHCSSKAKVGRAVAITPLLRDPLRGSAYFVKNPARAIPDLIIALRGAVDLDLTGKVSIPGGKRLATRFDTLPDAAITRFTLRLVAGKNGPVGIAADLCTASSKGATAAIGVRGQNGKLVRISKRLKVVGCPTTSRR